MKLLILLLLVGAAFSAPASSESNESNEEKLVINEEFFPDQFKVYTAEHDIIQILVPLNALNFEDDTDDDDEEDRSTVFFVEADIKDGVKDYKGLSVLIKGNATKLLETGTDVAAANDDSKTAYISATDGLYIYNDKENKAEKFGPITDNLIGIAKVNGSDEIYILNDKNEVYKVTENGTKSVNVDKIVGAKQIVLDYSNNLYYYGEDKQPHVLVNDEVKKIEGLPSNPNTIELLKPAFIIEDGVPCILDDKVYIIYANGTSEITEIELQVKPSAYSTEATLIQYYGYKKSIYEYNLLALMFGEVLDQLKNFLNDKTNEIQSIATRSRSDLRA